MLVNRSLNDLVHTISATVPTPTATASGDKPLVKVSSADFWPFRIPFCIVFCGLYRNFIILENININGLLKLLRIHWLFQKTKVYFVKYNTKKIKSNGRT